MCISQQLDIRLYCCAKVLNLRKDDEIIVPNLTFVSCVTSMLINLKVKLCEIKI